MDRAYTLLLVALLVIASAPGAAAPTSAPSPPPVGAAEVPVGAPIHDAGLWLTIGAASFTAVTAGVAIGVDAALDKPMDFGDRQLLRTTGLVSALLAIMGGATTATGLVFLAWPAE